MSNKRQILPKAAHLLWILFICNTLIGLTGCGFQLRGQEGFPACLQVLYLQTENTYDPLETTLHQKLRQIMRSSGVQLVETMRQAPVTLQLSRPIQTINSNVIGPSSQTRIYTVHYSVSVTLMDSHGKILTGPRLLQTSRSLTLSANQLLESNNQLDILTQEMEQEILNQLYQVLHAKQVLQSLDCLHNPTTFHT